MERDGEGQKSVADSIKERFGEDWYTEIGRKGGKASHTGGFAARPELASDAGRKGGLASGAARRAAAKRRKRALHEVAGLRRLAGRLSQE